MPSRRMPTLPQGVFVQACRALAEQPLGFGQNGAFGFLRIEDSLTKQRSYTNDITSIAFAFRHCVFPWKGIYAIKSHEGRRSDRDGLRVC